MPTDKRTIRWYNENASGYTSHVRNPQESIYHSLYEKPAMYGLLSDLKGKNVLSLGCGSGEDSKHLKTMGAKKSVGIDISKELIKIASESYPTCEFRVMNMERLDFSDRSFDFVYSSLAIHYLKNWSKVFQEAYRILKPGGRMIFSCEHPIWSSMEVVEDSDNKKIKEFAFITDKKSSQVKIIGDYLRTKKLFDALGKTARVTTWHKPMSEITGEISKSGLLIVKIVEPKPLISMRKISPKDFFKLERIPFALIFVLIKPSKGLI